MSNNVIVLAAVLAFFFWSTTTVNGSVAQVGTLTPFTPLEVPSGDSTYGTVISPDGRHVYGLNSGVTHGNASISQFSRDPNTGELTPLTPFQVEAIVYFMGVFDSTGSFLYVPALNVSIFSRNQTTGQLTFVGSVTRNASLYGYVRHIWVSISPDDTTLYVSGGGGLAVYSRNTTDGSLTILQEIDKVIIWAGSAISPDGQYFYVTSLYDGDVYHYYGSGSSENLTAVYQFQILPNHTLAPLTPAYVKGCNASYTIVLSPDGRSLYLSCSGIEYSGGEDAVIREYSINSSGSLSFVRSYPSCLGGLMIAMPSDGASLYQNCYLNNSIAQYYRNVTTGELSELTPFLVVAGDAPTFGIAFSPDNSHLYVSNSAAGPAGGDGNGTLGIYARVVPSSSTTPSTTPSTTLSNSPVPISSFSVQPSSQPNPSLGSTTGTTGRKRKGSTTGRRSTTGKTPGTTGTGTTGVSDAWSTTVSLTALLSTVVGLCLAIAF